MTELLNLIHDHNLLFDWNDFRSFYTISIFEAIERQCESDLNQYLLNFKSFSNIYIKWKIKSIKWQ